MLKQLNLKENLLTKINGSIESLQELTHLYLSNNDITSLPTEIGNLGSLKELYLSCNINLNNLPLELAVCPQLQILALDKCPLNSIPTEFVNGGPAYVIQYMR